MNSSEGYTGERPTDIAEADITVDGQTGKSLKGYAWWAEMIYVPFPNNSNNILAITKTDEVSGSFSNTLTKILSTLEF